MGLGSDDSLPPGLAPLPRRRPPANRVLMRAGPRCRGQGRICRRSEWGEGAERDSQDGGAPAPPGCSRDQPGPEDYVTQQELRRHVGAAPRPYPPPKEEQYMPRWGRYEELRPAQIEKIIEEAGIAYLPWGSLEWHGPHCAIGLDALKIHHLALRCAEVTGGVVLPVVYAGYQTMKPHADFKHTIEVPAEVIHGLVNAYLDQLADEGFRLVVLMMGHYGGEHVKNIRFAVENWPRYRDPGTGMRIWAFPEPEIIAEDGYRGDHAGAYESSLLMYFRPDLVELGALPADGELDGKALGIGGEDPRTKANPEYGRELCEAVVNRVTEGVRERLSE